MRTPLPCPVCAALVTDDHAHIAQHVTWHEDSKTLGPKRGSYATAIALQLGFEEMRAAVALVERDDDDAPTAKLPPVRDTVRRRPPVPPALIPGTPAQWRALAAAMEDDGLDVEGLAVEVRDDDDTPDRSYCAALNTWRDDGVSYQCEQRPGHEGKHTAMRGQLVWS